MIVVTGLVLLVIGGLGGYQLANFPKIIEIQQQRAIQNHFSVEANEFTYESEGVESNYLLSLDDKEYRIKFSKNKPMKVVYAEELLPLEGE